MTQEKDVIDELERLHAAATQGEWEDHWEDVCEQKEEEQAAITSSAADLGGLVVGLIWYDGLNIAIRKADAAFIVESHNRMPALLAYVRALEAVFAAQADPFDDNEYCEALESVDTARARLNGGQ